MKSNLNLLSSVVVAGALSAAAGCPAPEDPPADPPAGDVIEATVTLKAAMGTTMPLEVTANCDVTALELVNAGTDIVEIEGLGTRTLQLRADVSGPDARKRLLGVKDEEIVVDLQVRVSCADRDTVLIDGGFQPFFPASSQRSVTADATESVDGTIIVHAKPSSSSTNTGDVLFSAGGGLYVSRDDGTSSSRAIEPFRVSDVRDAAPAYGVGDWFVKVDASVLTEDTLFLDETLQTLSPEIDASTALELQTYAGKIYELTPATGGLGNHGIKVYELDGTITDHTLEGVILARSATSFGDGRHQLMLLSQPGAVVLMQTDPLADDGVASLTTIALPAKYPAEQVNTFKFQIAAPRDFGDIYISITRGSDTTIYRSAFSRLPVDSFGPLEEVGTLLASELQMAVQSNGRLWISHNADITVLGDDDSLELLLSVPGHVVAQTDGIEGAFMLKEADRFVAYNVSGDRLFKFPAVLSRLGTRPSFDLTMFWQDGAIQLFEHAGLERMDLQVIQ